MELEETWTTVKKLQAVIFRVITACDVRTKYNIKVHESLYEKIRELALVMTSQPYLDNDSRQEDLQLVRSSYHTST